MRRQYLMPCALALTVAVSAAILHAVNLEPVASPAPPAELQLDDINGLATVDDLIGLVPELAEPLGTDLPVMLWGNFPGGARDRLEVEELLQARGLCLPGFIGYQDDEGLDEVARVIAFRHERGWPAAVICQGWGQVCLGEKRAPAHQPPAIQDTKHYPCPGVYEDLIACAQARAVADLERLTARGVAPDIFLMDWEVWNRFVWEIRDVKANLGDRLEQARLCPVCREKLPAEYLESPEAFLRGLEIIRGKIAHEAFVAPVKERFPDALIGNYFTTSHVRSDQPLEECRRVVGWYGSGFDFSQPVAYGHFWSYHGDPELVGWNVFWKYLGELTSAARNQVGEQFQLPWSARLLEYQPTEPFEARGAMRWAWPRESYREYLRHCLLRGARTLAVFKPNKEGPGNRLMVLTELQDVLGVFAEMRAHADLLREGAPMNLQDLPGAAFSAEGAVVWSGVATADRALVRTVSFTGQDEEVEVEVFGEQMTLPAPVAGATWLLRP